MKYIRRMVAFILSILLLLSMCGCGNGSPAAVLTKTLSSSASLPDVVGMTYDEAYTTLTEAGFKNISPSDTDWPEEMLVVEAVDKPAGGFTKASVITLQCSRLVQLTLNLSSASNLLLNRYDVEVFLNDTSLGYIANGKTLSGRYTVPAGETVLKVTKMGSSSPSGSFSFKLTTHTSYSLTITHSSNEIAFKDTTTMEMPYIQVLEMPDVTGMLMTDAKTELAEMGFTNVKGSYPSSEEKINTNNWLVEAQSVPAGTALESNQKVTLTGSNLDEYFNSTYSKLFLQDALALEADLGFEIEYYDADTKASIASSDIPASDTAKWSIDSADQNGSARKIRMYIRYRGDQIKVPDVTGLVLGDANSALEDAGFTNTSFLYDKGSKFTNYDEWYVVSQDTASGGTAYSNDLFTLHVENISKYFNKCYQDLNLKEALAKGTDLGFDIVYQNAETGKEIKKSTIPSSSQEEWYVMSAEQKGSDKILVWNISELGKAVTTPSLTGKLLSEAEEAIEAEGLENVTIKINDNDSLDAPGEGMAANDPDSIDKGTYLVISQNPVGGEDFHTKEELVLTVEAATDYFNRSLSGKTLTEAVANGMLSGFTIYCYNNKTKQSSLYEDLASTIDTDYWTVSSAAQYGTNKTIILYATYQSGFITKDNGTIYVDPDTGIITTGWKEIEGYWRYFGADGILYTGLKKINGKSYYLSQDYGKMAYGWMQLGNDWYFFDRDSGAMVTGWLDEGGAKYYFASDGKMVSGETLTINGTKYTFLDTGKLKVESTSSSSSQTTTTTSGTHYVINTDSGKFHYSYCPSAINMNSENRVDYYGSASDLIARGYSPCKRCNPG